MDAPSASKFRVEGNLNVAVVGAPWRGLAEVPSRSSASGSMLLAQLVDLACPSVSPVPPKRLQ